MPTPLGPHATIFDHAHILCACPELGCNQRTIEYGGKVHHGRIFYRKNYPKHLQDAANVPPADNSATSNPALTTLQTSQLGSTGLQQNPSEGVSNLCCPTRSILLN